MYYNKIYEKLLSHEFGYVNDPLDSGGETYNGISRNNYPNWDGWDIIDAAKSDKIFPDNINSRKNKNAYTIALETKQQEFYKKEYYDKLKLDKYKTFELQYELFEIAVNIGIPRTVMFLQEILNIHNKKETLYPDLKVDGIIGAKTFDAIDKFFKEAKRLNRDGEIYLSRLLNVWQGCWYKDLIINNKNREKWTWGWFNRVC